MNLTLDAQEIPRTPLYGTTGFLNTSMEPVEQTINEPFLVGTKDAAEMLSIAPKKVRELVKRGLLDTHPAFEKFLFRVSELRAFSEMSASPS